MADRRTKKDETADAEPAAESEPTPEAGFENRAARRARKRSQAPKAAGRIDPHGDRRQVQAPRSWSTRRSG
jgi:hypothetical protein